MLTGLTSEEHALIIRILVSRAVAIVLIFAWFYIIEPLKERAKEKALRRKNMNKSLLTIYKEPGKGPTVKVIDNELKPLQRAVGGHIEVVNYKNGVILLVNEEGRLLHMPENILGIAGPIVAIRAKGEEFDSIRSAEVPKLLKELSE